MTDWRSKSLMSRVRVGEVVKEEIYTQYSTLTRFHSAKFSIRTEIEDGDPKNLTLIDMFQDATPEDFEALGREILDKYIESKMRNL